MSGERPDLMTDRETVRRQYADEGNLETRRSVWRPAADGRDPVELALAAVVEALPACRSMPDVLEVGCGPGAAARAVADRLTTGQVLAIDRSAVAVEQAVRASADRPDDGRLRFRHVAAEDLALEPGEQPYDFVLPFRVGALDGRHPALGERVLHRLRAVTTPSARLFVDGGDPLRELPLR